MIRITSLVDNTAGRTHKGVWGEHGLSFLVETPHGRVLFDTGSSGTVLAHNASLLDVDFRTVDVLVFSHAHYDHTGGAGVVLDHRPDIPIYAHTTFLRERYARRNGEYVDIGIPPHLRERIRAGRLYLHHKPVQVLPRVWTTGEIRQRLEPEGRSPHHVIRTNKGWQPDPYEDDMALVIEADAGLILICGCCHAGLLNTLSCVRHTFGRPITAVFGGTHLVSADKAYLEHVVEVFSQHCPDVEYYLNHCTGEKAYVALANAFGDRVHPCPVGTRVDIP
ncbi:MAG: MBL fold metallo-hydrolase [Chloroflexi bacterium]|nr:MBL fold metallo-hydrolase [Chloroflexota bacterium]